MALPTRFAPAECAPKKVLEDQAGTLERELPLMPFFNALPNVCVVLNRQRQIVLANRAAQDLINSTHQGALGKRFGDLLGCVHASETPGGCGTTRHCQTCGAVWAILASLNGKRTVEECRITQLEGDALDLRLTATPFVAGGTQFSVVVVEDISAEKRRQVLERLFFHDVLNTAGGISGLLGAFHEGYLTPNENYINALYRQSLRLNEELGAQRDLMEAENHELRPAPSVVNTLDILCETQSFATYHYATDAQRVVIAPDTDDMTITTDKVLLGRVVGNMVKNALEAAGLSESVTITCVLAETGAGQSPEVVFSVQNSAVMPPNVQLQVFQRSFSTKGRGRGLGTYSMKLLTERYLNGRVSFVSKPETGTIFHVTIPVDWA